MRQYWVYELVAGPWRYIGMTSNIEARLQQHRKNIRAGGRGPNWQPALSEYPEPESWNINVLSGPYECKEKALAQESQLQKMCYDEPGRVWQKEGNCGQLQTTETKEKRAQKHRGRKNSPETIEKMRQSQTGKTHSIETREKIASTKRGQPGKQHSKETREKLRQKALEREARKRAEKAISSD